GRPASTIGPFAVAVDAPTARGLATVPGAGWVERIRNSRRLAFTPNDPLVSKQWYLTRIRAFDAWTKPPPFAYVPVAVLDCGIVDDGARVINLSFGALRDPFDRGRDLYSPLEASAVEYAVAHGALVVAAVGNADDAPQEPWPFASYPAALPHVLGVSAVARDG